MKCKGFADLHHLSENERIEVIGNHILEKANTSDMPYTVAFVVDDIKKAKRYVKKIAKKFPTIRHVETLDGPCENMVTVKLGEALQ